MKTVYRIFLSIVLIVSIVSCSDFLDRESDSIFTDDQIFSDEAMIKSALANFYGRINWGQSFDNEGNQFGMIDEACFANGIDNSITFADDLWRVYPYKLIRNLNQFIHGVRTTTVLEQADRLKIEAEARFIRAWAYFNMARCLGGMPIVGDNVFEYDPKGDIAAMQFPRSTEGGIYNYVIDECSWAGKYLSDNPSENINAARANKWVALSLKARAAIYAGSLAKYNNQVTPQIKTNGPGVGISADSAAYYYNIAYETADSIIRSGKYQLYNKESDKSHNFYMATASKNDNPEVIWALDYKYPDKVQDFSIKSCPKILAMSTTYNRVTPLLNLVEAYEYLDNRDGRLDVGTEESPRFFDSPADLFDNKDPRMKGTIICSGDEMLGTQIDFQAGQYYYKGRKWATRESAVGSLDDQGDVITSINGPKSSSNWFDNQTGFSFRKFLDEDKSAYDPAHGSEIWYVRIRYAEILLIASEAALELGNDDKALEYINDVRERAGLNGLESMTLLDIEQERRVEFALENQRWWDLKRWRRSHIVWDGVSESARHWALFPYKVKDPRRPENGKWVFIRVKSNDMPNYRTFKMQNYYNFLDNSWLTNNPKLIRNPYQ